jgi:alanyl-tRNA synthetase
LTGDEIREAFLHFFEDKGHLPIPSSSLIPAADPTLLLTNAGMVQFKPYFTGEMTSPGPRLTSAQKCFRTTDIDSVGDSTHLTFFEMLGNFSVGDYFKKEAIAYAWEFVTNHLKLEKDRLWATVFVDDDEAVGYWTETGISLERIRRFGEADNFWGPAGNEGPCGPCSEIHYDFGQGLGCRQPDCGPNCENPVLSEIEGTVADTGLKRALSAVERCDRFVELWNLVFMQFYQAADGSRALLPAPNIDTGMGLERAAAIMQGKRSIYETDIFAPIVEKVAELCGKEYGKDPDADYAMRVVAEHTRSAAFLISDGVVPGNDGRDYILRRILRRAVYVASTQLNLDVNYLRPVLNQVITLMYREYPELHSKGQLILRLAEDEERRFVKTLDRGREIINAIVNYRSHLRGFFEKALKEPLELRQVPFSDLYIDFRFYDEVSESDLRDLQLPESVKEIEDKYFEALLGQRYWEASNDAFQRALEQVNHLPGEELFVLHDTYGFPPELTQEIAREYGLEVDMEGFEREMEAQRERARGSSGKFGGDFDTLRVYQALGVGSTTFLGYQTLSASTVVVGLLAEGQPVNQAVQGQKVEVVLRETPFYAEMGGQVGDAGEIAGQGSTLRVEDAQAPIAGLTVHRCTVLSGSIAAGDTVEATVDPHRRADTARNHTATHMLHAALRQVLGNHVRQHGSLVAPDRLRFDFTHVSALSQEEMREVQRLTNYKILENLQVGSQETTYRQAVLQGALAFFGDRYGDQVRVVEVAPSTDSGQAGAPFSLEVCGGTHVHRTGDIGICIVLSESSIGSGLRRVEAVTGRAAEALMSERSSYLEDVAHRLQVPQDQLATRVDVLLAELEHANRRSEALERELLKRQIKDLPQKQIAGINVVSGILSVSFVELLREAGDWLKNDIKSGVVLLGTAIEGRPTMIVMATQDMVTQGFNAGNVVRDAAKVMGGGGGGRPDMGQAGGRDPDKLKAALQEAEEEVRLWREKP